MKCLVLAGMLVFSQTLAFEVATIKPSAGGNIVMPNGTPVHAMLVFCHGVEDNSWAFFDRIGMPPPALGRCQVFNNNLRAAIGLAYPGGAPTTMRIIGGPSWLDSYLWDVEAKAENPATTTHAQLLAMMQNLLTDRFKLRFHTEPRQVQGFSLVIASNGPKLKPGSGEVDNVGEHFGPGLSEASAKNAPISTLARYLSGQLRGPVTDQTELKGTYEIAIPLTTTNPDAITNSIYYGLSTLGLKIQAQKVTIDVMVIDSIERPDRDRLIH